MEVFSTTYLEQFSLRHLLANNLSSILRHTNPLICKYNYSTTLQRATVVERLKAKNTNALPYYYSYSRSLSKNLQTSLAFVLFLSSMTKQINVPILTLWLQSFHLKSFRNILFFQTCSNSVLSYTESTTTCQKVTSFKTSISYTCLIKCAQLSITTRLISKSEHDKTSSALC